MTEGLKVKRSLFQTRHTVLSIFYTKSICIKSCIYIIGSLSIIYRGFKFVIWVGITWGRIDNLIWEGKLRRMTLSESRPKKKKKKMLRKEYKQQKKKGTIYMVLFLFKCSISRFICKKKSHWSERNWLINHIKVI